jgi:hypothetical protein
VGFELVLPISTSVGSLTIIFNVFEVKMKREKIRH